MAKLLCRSIIVMLLFVCCTNNSKKKEYNKIIKGLSNNYIFWKEGMKESEFYDVFDVDEERFLRDSIEFRKSIKRFYQSDPRILEFLFQFENDTLNFVNWVKTKDPYSSTLYKSDFLTKSQSAIILIDNYLMNRNDTILISSYQDSLNFKIMRDFYMKNKLIRNKENLYHKYIEFLKANNLNPLFK